MYEITKVFAELYFIYLINNQIIMLCARNNYSEISFLTRYVYGGTTHKTLLLWYYLLD